MVLGEEALDESAALGPVVEELGSAAHGHPADLAARPHALGDDRDAGIAAQVLYLREAGDADHRDRVGLVEEPHRHGERRTVGPERRQHHDFLGAEISLDALVGEALGRGHRAHAVGWSAGASAPSACSAGMTSAANRRMLRSASSAGMPAKLNTPT